MLPPAILWFPFSTLIDCFVENELVYILVGTKQNSFSLLQNIDKNNRTNRNLLQELLVSLG